MRRNCSECLCCTGPIRLVSDENPLSRTIQDMHGSDVFYDTGCKVAKSTSLACPQGCKVAKHLFAQGICPRLLLILVPF